MKNLKVRQALAVATDRTGYITAARWRQGRQAVAKSHRQPDAHRLQGQPELHVPRRAVTRRRRRSCSRSRARRCPTRSSTPTRVARRRSDKAAAALKAGWDKAGFKVTLDPLTDTYYDVDPEARPPTSDVIWGGWGADWPSIATVHPAAVRQPDQPDRRPPTARTTATTSSDEVNKLIDEAAHDEPTSTSRPRSTPRSTTSSARTWPTSRLEVTQFYFLRGSKVDRTTSTPAASNGYPDLGADRRDQLNHAPHGVSVS